MPRRPLCDHGLQLGRRVPSGSQASDERDPNVSIIVDPDGR